MREAAEQGAVELRVGKGYGLPLTATLVEFLAEAMDQIRTLWEAVDTPDSFFKELPWTDVSEDPKYGTTKWVAFPTSPEGDEFRLQVRLGNNGKLRIDFREWYVPH